MIDIDWHDMNALPLVNQRCIFELRSGFRFYGKLVGRDTVESYLTGRQYNVLALSRWRKEDVPMNPGAEERCIAFRQSHARRRFYGR